MNSQTTKLVEFTDKKFRNSISTLQSSVYRSSIDSAIPLQSLFYSSSKKENKQRISLNAKNALKLAIMLDQLEQEKEASYLDKLRTSLTQIEQKLKKVKPIMQTKESVKKRQCIGLDLAKLNRRNDKNFQKNDETSTIESLPGSDQPIAKYYKCNPKKEQKYYLSELYQTLNQGNSRATDHLNLSKSVFKNLSSIKPPTFAQIYERRLHLAQRAEDKGKPTLVLDIDETLIHCQENPSLEYDTILPIETANGSIAQAFIRIRPYAISFLKRMSKHFEIICFTASHQSYADVVLDELDPNREYIKHRLYRKHCIEVYENLLIKDLRIIDRDLSQMVLVDNAPYSYIFQPENGIPILPFYEGQDSELYKLEKYLLHLVKCKDMREKNKKTFQFHRYNEFSEARDVLNGLYFSQV